MVGFAYDDAQLPGRRRRAAEAQKWADRLGVDRSELLRDVLHRHLTALRGEVEAERYHQLPPTDSELALVETATWGPAEGWADWSDCSDDAPR